jgi:hypothetical protein
LAKPKQKPESQWDPKTRRFFGFVFAVFGLIGVFVLVSRYTTASATQAVLALGGRVNIYADLGTELGAVDLRGLPITDADLAHLHPYFFWSRGPSTLTLANTPITDASLAHFSGLLFLTKLDLSETAITGPGLIHLNRMGFIGHDEGGIAVELNLSKTKIDNSALGPISTIRRLNVLNLSGTNISGAALSQITHLPALYKLTLTGCPNLNAADIAALRRQLPNLSVIH